MGLTCVPAHTESNADRFDSRKEAWVTVSAAQYNSTVDKKDKEMYCPVQNAQDINRIPK